MIERDIWLPTKIIENKNGGKAVLEWCKRKDLQFTDPFFYITIDKHELQLEKRLTDPSVLMEYFSELTLPEPSGFIFHLTRCGSTMISQMLKQDPENLVLSEPGAAEQILELDNFNFSQKVSMLIGVMRAFADNLNNPEKRFFVKFSSAKWLPWIKLIYPNVPWIFVFRHPEEIIRSNMINPPGWLDKIDDDKKALALYEKLDFEMNIAMKYINSSNLLVQYEDIDEDFSEKLLEAFGLPLSPKILAKMKDSLRWYSKGEGVSWEDRQKNKERFLDTYSEKFQFEIPNKAIEFYNEFQKLSKAQVKVGTPMSNKIQINLKGTIITKPTVRVGKEISSDTLLNSGVITKDCINCDEIRKKALIDDFLAEFEGKTVLELGPNTGVFSSTLAEYAKKLVIVESNPMCVEILKERLPASVKIYQEDFHHQLWKFTPGEFDIIVCAGVLYNSASPYFLLEAMAYLKPKKVLLDTLLAPTGSDIGVYVTYPLNYANYRYNKRPDSRVAILLSEIMIDRAMRDLGFTYQKRIETSDLEIPTNRDSNYFQRWKRSYSKWWTGF